MTPTAPTTTEAAPEAPNVPAMPNLPMTINCSDLERAVIEQGQRGLLSVDDFDEFGDETDIPSFLPRTLGDKKLVWFRRTEETLNSGRPFEKALTPITIYTPGFKDVIPRAVFGSKSRLMDGELIWCCMEEPVYQKFLEAQREPSRAMHAHMDGQSHDGHSQKAFGKGEDDGILSTAMSVSRIDEHEARRHVGAVR